MNVRTLPVRVEGIRTPLFITYASEGLTTPKPSVKDKFTLTVEPGAASAGAPGEVQFVRR